jgi:hypothetical protein
MNVTLNGVQLECWDVCKDHLKKNSYIYPPSITSVLTPGTFLTSPGRLDWLASEATRWARKWGLYYPVDESAYVEGLFLERADGPLYNENTGRLYLWPGAILMTADGYTRHTPTFGWKLPPELEGRMTASASRYGSPWWWAEANLEKGVITSV